MPLIIHACPAHRNSFVRREKRICIDRIREDKKKLNSRKKIILKQRTGARRSSRFPRMYDAGPTRVPVRHVRAIKIHEKLTPWYERGGQEKRGGEHR